MREQQQQQKHFKKCQKAGCVPVRRCPITGEWQFLLIQSRWTSNVWAFPKGTVEDGETPLMAAIRETIEEGGVTGQIDSCLGTWYLSSYVQLSMWLLLVDTQLLHDDLRWIERSQRIRAWFSIQQTRQLLLKQPKFHYLNVFDNALLALSQFEKEQNNFIFVMSNPTTTTTTTINNNNNNNSNNTKTNGCRHVVVANPGATTTATTNTGVITSNVTSNSVHNNVTTTCTTGEIFVGGTEKTSTE